MARGDRRGSPGASKGQGRRDDHHGPARRDRNDRTETASPKTDWRDRPPREKPHGDKLLSRVDRPRGAPRSGFGGRPEDRRPERKDRYDARAPKVDWRARPPRSKPHGDALPVPPPRDRQRDPRDQNRGNETGRSGGPRPALNEWRRDAARQSSVPREKPHGDPLKPGGRPFDRKKFPRNQGPDEPRGPVRPRGPNREPRPGEPPEPTPPPRPSEPVIPPPGPPERGRRRPPRLR
jgi:hypothetical protein